MYLYETITEKSRMVNGFIPKYMKGFMIPKFNDNHISEADRMEVWASSFKDDSSDFCEFRLIKNNEIIANERVSGY